MVVVVIRSTGTRGIKMGFGSAVIKPVRREKKNRVSFRPPFFSLSLPPSLSLPQRESGKAIKVIVALSMLDLKLDPPID